MTIDMHTHYVPAEMAEAFRARRIAPWIEAKPNGKEWLHMPVGSLEFGTEYVDMDRRVAFMDRLGIATQWLSFPGLFGLDSRPAAESLPLLKIFNDDAAALAQRRPDRFVALAALPMADMAEAVAEFRRARTTLGHVGAILPNNAFLTIAEAEKLKPLFAAGQELGAHFFIHPGRRPDEVKMDEPSIPPLPFPDLPVARQALNLQDRVGSCMATLLFSDFLDDYPNVTVHVANMGGTLPIVIERMDHVLATRGDDAEPMRRRRGNLYVDCSSLGPHALEIAVAVYGADRIVVGTDCPIFRTDWTLGAIRDARIDAAARDAILRGNAMELLARLTG